MVFGEIFSLVSNGVGVLCDGINHIAPIVRCTACGHLTNSHHNMGVFSGKWRCSECGPGGACGLRTEVRAVGAAALSAAAVVLTAGAAAPAVIATKAAVAGANAAVDEVRKN
ncbi:hypothetical protein HDU96_002249 [Phlyctochytrium bullatum]|nr:hypothetical protein HDU96_002249 [Phlyctochytrium bullatum]